MYKIYMVLSEDIELDDRYIYIAADGRILRLTASEILDSTIEISNESFMKECNNDKQKANELIKNYLDKR